MIVYASSVCFVCSRPRTVDDVAYQDEVVAVLKKTLEGSDASFFVFFQSIDSIDDCFILF